MTECGQLSDRMVTHLLYKKLASNDLELCELANVKVKSTIVGCWYDAAIVFVTDATTSEAHHASY